MAKLSEAMERGMELAQEHGGLIRRRGGWWTPPGEAMEGPARGPVGGSARYVGTRTVEALERRGLLELGEWRGVPYALLRAETKAAADA